MDGWAIAMMVSGGLFAEGVVSIALERVPVGAGAARTLASLAAAGFVLVLVGSVAWLVPIQRTLKSGTELPAADVERLRARWLRGHLVRTVLGVAALACLITAVTYAGSSQGVA
jgi:uncharacterized membrane protein